MVRQKIKVKLNAIMDDMQQHFSGYRELITSHVAAILKDELKKVIDLSLNELGFRTDEEREDLPEPVSNLNRITKQLQKVSDDFERFKLETKEHFKKPKKKVAQMAEKEIQALNDKLVNMLKTKPDSVPYCWDYTKNIPAELFLKGC